MSFDQFWRKFLLIKPIDVLFADIDYRDVQFQAQFAEKYDALKYKPNLQYTKQVYKKIAHSQQILNDTFVEQMASLYAEASGDFGYVSYLLDTSDLHLRVSNKIISQGTTGLCVWPAAQIFAAWLMDNCNQFQNGCVLELGSGIGLVASVLGHLSNQKELNTRITCSDIDENVLSGLKQNVSQISALQLDFTKDGIPNNVFDGNKSNYIIASDCCYDPELVISLCNYLEKAFEYDSKLTAYITVMPRSQELWDMLLQQLARFTIGISELNERQTEIAVDTFGATRFEAKITKIFQINK